MSSPHDFDFFHGEWDVRHRRLTDFLDPDSGWEEFGATNRCWSLFDGAANIDEMTVPGQGWQGLTLRLFDPAARVWSLNWSSSRSGKLFPPVVGRFGPDGRGEFHGDDTHDGKDVRGGFGVGGDPPAHGPLGAGLLRGRGEDVGDQLGHGVRAAGIFLNARSANRGSGRGTS
jgi:hypothetical protein